MDNSKQSWDAWHGVIPEDDATVAEECAARLNMQKAARRGAIVTEETAKVELDEGTEEPSD